MKLCRFDADRLGLVRGDQVLDVTSALDALPAYRVPLPRHDPVIAELDRLRPAIEAAAEGARAVPLAAVRLLSPVANPGKVVAAPVNYRKHLDEAIAEPETFSRAHVNQIQESGLFLKATSSIVGASDEVVLGFPERRNDHEVELAVIIGRRATRVPAAEALDYVAGYCIGLDMTLRGPEERSFRKSIDTYTVLGPWLVTADEFGRPDTAKLEIRVGDEVRQSADTRDLIMDVPALIEFASRYYTLEPGDVLLSGTPEGVGPVKAGDVMTAEIERIGRMVVRVAA